MSSGKIIGSIVVVILGCALIPAGFLTNSYLQGQVTGGIPQVLSGIRNATVPQIKEMAKEEGTPDALLEIQSQTTPQIAQMVTSEGTPAALVQCENGLMGTLESATNLTITANAISQVVTGLAGSVGNATAFSLYFNNQLFKTAVVPTSPIYGISEYNSSMSYSLNFTFQAENTTLYGNMLLGIPGWLSDLSYGTGVTAFLSFYANAATSQYANTTMQSAWNATWGQLTALYLYLEQYMISGFVPGYLAQLGYSGVQLLYPYAAYAQASFYTQWANGTFLPSLGLTSIGSIEPALAGFEAGLPTALNITQALCASLWNASDTSAFVNATGITAWVSAINGNTTVQTSLATHFLLTSTNLTILLGWLGMNFMTNIFPGLVPQLEGMSLDAYSLVLFYQQWANGTLLPAGLGTVDPRLVGFEVAIPVATNLTHAADANLSLGTIQNLWNPANGSTFVNATGITEWLKAVANASAPEVKTLEDLFGLTSAQMTLLLQWLPEFMNDVFPNLVPSQEGMSLDAYSLVLFYQQWANGTLLPAGLGSVSGILQGFEVGLPNATGLTLAQCQALWNEDNATSLLSVAGFAMWQSAVNAPTGSEATQLQASYGLTNAQMSSMLSWIQAFRTTVAPAAAPDIQTANTMGPMLQWLMLAGGIDLIIIGALVIGFSKRS